MKANPGRAAASTAVTLTVWAFMASACAEVGGQTMTGTYSIQVQQETSTLSLVSDADGGVTGWMRALDGTVYALSGFEVVDEDGERSVEGTLSGPAAAEFTLYPEDDGAFGFLLTPHDAAGAPQLAQARVFAAERTSTVALVQDEEAVGAGPPPGEISADRGGTVAGLDARLVGVWATQVMMNSEAGSVATQLRMEFTADGMMRELGARSLGGFDAGSIDTGVGTSGEQAAWRVDGGVLVVSYAGSPWVPFARFEVSDARLVLRYLQDGSVQIWSRQR